MGILKTSFGLRNASVLLLACLLAAGCSDATTDGEGSGGDASGGDITVGPDGAPGDGVTAPDGATSDVVSDAGDGATNGDTGPGEDGGPAGDTAGDTATGDDVVLTDGGAATDAGTGTDCGPGDDGCGGTITEDAGPSEDVVDAPPAGYPGAGLVLKIVSPAGTDATTVIGSKITVGGVLFGDADTITWSSTDGSEGSIAVNGFWTSGPIELQVGDNSITVTATHGEEVVSDTIDVTYNPAFRFDDSIVARPNIVWTSNSQSVVFTIPASLFPNFQGNTLTLHEVDQNGAPITALGQMLDNGNTAGIGDEIEGDGVFTAKKTVNCSGVGHKYYRASVEVDQGASSYTAYSAVTRVLCLEHFSSNECTSHQQVIMAAEQAALAGASPQDVVTSLQANNQVSAAGVAEEDGHSVWIQFTSGVLGAVLLAPPGIRGSGGFDPPEEPSLYEAASVLQNAVDIGSKKAIVLAPFANEFGATDDGPQVATVLATSDCPSFTVEGGTALQGTAASLEKLRGLNEFGVVSISTHGEALFADIETVQAQVKYGWDNGGAKEVVWTGEPVQCNQLLQTNKNCTVTGSNPTGGCPVGTVCEITSGSGGGSASGVCVDRTQVDLVRGNVVLTNKGYAVTPSFFESYAGRGFPNTLFNLGACRTLYNGSMAAALFSKGAQAITGFSGYVDSQWAKDRVVEMFEGSVGSGLIGQFHTGGEDPGHPGTHWRLFGAGNLSLSNANIINAGFETGDATGWTRDGDGRVISQLGSANPVGGKFMGLLSTGLGFTVQTGSLEQEFCIPADKTTAQIYWKMYSEEFKEYCGSTFQDTFQAVLTGGGGQLTLVDVKVDDICGYGDGSCNACANPIACDFECMGSSGCTYDDNLGTCTGSYPCECGKYYTGLTPSDVGFDQGGVFNILWKKTTKNIQALAGAGRVKLRLFASDTGDSIFDTVILVDSIEFN